jgi:Putative amidase domain
MKMTFKNTVIAGVIAMVGSHGSVVYAASSSSCSDYNNSTKSCNYKPSHASSFAKTNALLGTGNTGFPDFTGVGGDCTNFASSAIMAGLVGNTDPNTVVNNAKFFQSSPWYFAWGTPFTRGTAWTGAHEFYTYAKTTRTKGMKFSFVTRDSPTQALAFSQIQVGDLVFADWTNDGTIDHSMIVTGKTANSYAGIAVSYRNSTGHNPQSNRALATFNSTRTAFHVYRPVSFQD